MNLLVRLFWPLFYITIGYFAYISVFVLPAIKAEAAGLVPLDILLTGYSFDQAVYFFQANAASGGAEFSNFHAFDDVIFPALYGVTLSLGIWTLTRNWVKTVRIIICGLPLAAMVIDYLENARIIAMINSDPVNISAAMVSAASILTETKFQIIGLTFLVMVIILTHNYIVNSLPPKRPKQIKPNEQPKTNEQS